jgi:hypothetical protein
MHDFDLFVADRVISLEVTSATDKSVRRLWHAVHETSWDEPSLSRSWALSLRPRIRIGSMRPHVAALLQVLEQNGVPKFPSSDASHSPPASVAVTQLKRLGVIGGLAVDSHPSRIVVGVAGPAEWGSDDDLNLAMAPAIADNIDKLRRATADERHLFVWLDWSDHRVQAATLNIVTLGRLPGSPPEFPEGLDVVWAMPVAMVGDTPRPLLVADRAGWRILGPLAA